MCSQYNWETSSECSASPGTRHSGAHPACCDSGESGDSPASSPVGADDLPLSPLSAAILKRVNHLSSQKDYWIRVDRWWIRVHVRPRRALFTPLLTANGPQRADQIHPRRRTVCIDSNDQAHIINDQWRSDENSAT